MANPDKAGQENLLGQILVSSNALRQEQLLAALAYQEKVRLEQKKQIRLGEVLLQLKMILSHHLEIGLMLQKTRRKSNGIGNRDGELRELYEHSVRDLNLGAMAPHLKSQPKFPWLKGFK